MAGRIALAVLAACAVGALVIILVTAIYVWVDQTGAREDVGPADCIIVLGSAVWPGERPSPSLAARTARGLALYQAGHAPALILCGGRGTYPPAEAEMMRRLLTAAGVPETALFLDDSSTTTVENLQHARAIMRAHGWQSALLVSDPFHLPRASLMARDLGLTVRPAPALDSPTYTIPRQRVWYTLREALALIWYTVLERPGLLAG
ncbi:MAG: YdcF family protein [Chloroflexi bacterium]|nr:YdcF family protein [Chloroflexota bacterium]MBU1751855.1 YdcF family protein [Chloroflexota bacterium]MBU1877843.1 YdcF family protein [Chloroflexota bacterium]